VPLSLEQSYRRRTVAAGTDHLLVQRVIRASSHCGFDGETREGAFDDLVAWIERGARPDGDDVHTGWSRALARSLDPSVLRSAEVDATIADAERDLTDYLGSLPIVVEEACPSLPVGGSLSGGRRQLPSSSC
jgi:hypothetical protein